MIPDFLKNLAETCKSDALIRSDGKKLNFIDRFRDLFRKRKPEDHLKEVVTTLASCEITLLSPEERFRILSRLTKVTGTSIKGLEEEKVFKDMDIDKVSTQLFEHILKVSRSSRRTSRDMQKIGMLISHYKSDEGALEK